MDNLGASRCLFWLLILPGLLLSCNSMATYDSFEVIREFELPAFREPSGIVFHDERGTLFIVGDEGDLGELSIGGELLRQQRLMDASFEGITVNPTTGMLYIAVEGDDEVLTVHPETFSVIERFTLDQHFENSKVLTKNKHGVEGVTYVPDVSSGSGSLWITNQVLDHNNPEDLSGVFQFALPTSSPEIAQPLELMSMIKSETVDLAGVFFHHVNEHLYVLSDKKNLMIEMTLSGSIIGRYALPGENQEGITLDQEGNFYIAQDNGGVLKLRFLAR